MNFLYKYYIYPILIDSGYNIINTLTYAFLAILILFGLYKYLQKAKIKPDLKFFAAIFPFIFFGSLVRSFVDHNYYIMTTLKKLLFITPGIWLLSVALAIIAIAIGVQIQKKHSIEYHKTTLAIGSLAIITLVTQKAANLTFDSLATAALILFIFTVLCTTIYAIAQTLNLKPITNKVGMLAISAQLWDATNTSTIIYLHNAWEKHPLPRLIIEKFGPWSFLVVKLVAILAAVTLLFKYVKDVTLRNTFLIGIAILGAGEGLRNFLSLILV